MSLSLRAIEVVLIPLAFLQHSVALASNSCNPKDFLIKEYSNISFDSITNIAVTDAIDSEMSKDQSKTFNGSATVYGVPVTLNWSDVRNTSELYKRMYGYAFSQDINYTIHKSIVSTNGANAYRDCLLNGINTVLLTVSSDQYNSAQFFVQVLASIKSAYPKTSVKITLKASDGLFENGRSIMSISIFNNTDKRILVTRNPNSQVSIVAESDDVSGDSATVPPAVKLAANTKLQSSKSADVHVNDYCCGMGARSQPACIDQTDDNSMLLTGTKYGKIDHQHGPGTVGGPEIPGLPGKKGNYPTQWDWSVVRPDKICLLVAATGTDSTHDDYQLTMHVEARELTLTREPVIEAGKTISEQRAILAPD